MGELRNYELHVNGNVFIAKMDTPSQQLRCVFDVIVSPGGSYSTADIRLYNLASASSPVISSEQQGSIAPAGLEPVKGNSVKLLAGYTRFESSVDASSGIVTLSNLDSIGEIFTGTIVNVFRERDGANIVTRLLCNSGVKSNDTGSANASYSQGVTLYDVLTDLCRAWGKKLVIADDKALYEKVVMLSGYVVDGDITRELNTLARAYKFTFINHNNEVIVSFPGAKRTTAKHLVSQSTGMIGIPELSGGNDGVYLDVSVRLNPFITLRDTFEIDAQFQTFNTGNVLVTSVEAHASGLWNINSIRYRGDNWGSMWRMDINAIRQGSVTGPTGLDIDAKLIFGSRVSQEFRIAVRDVGKELSIDPNWMMAVMAFETGRTFSPYIKNPGSSATGLIQFTSGTAASLGTSTTKIARMSAPEQIRGPVRDYFNQFKGRINGLTDTYMAVFAPIGIGKPDDFVLYSAPSREYNANAGLDKDRKGYITRLDCAARVNEEYKIGAQSAA
ncbi:hypothetical protein FZI56_21510 [Cronobacter sakazakii]|nr:hypothetical protein FZI56_21510 [Cronobacter sakazakii]